jgi:predicted RNA binding protein YcfA (HicA-like mRNA interferase family)
LRKKGVSTRDFLRALQKLGFVETRPPEGSHMLLRHPDSGLLVTVPTSRSEIPLAMRYGIERQMENFRIITREKFEGML